MIMIAFIYFLYSTYKTGMNLFSNHHMEYIFARCTNISIHTQKRLVLPLLLHQILRSVVSLNNNYITQTTDLNYTMNENNKIYYFQEDSDEKNSEIELILKPEIITVHSSISET